MRKTAWVALLSVGFFSACPRQEQISVSEAQQALEESSVDSQAAALSSASVEVSTDFTIGEAAANAAQHIRDFVQSQLPCADVTLEQATLTIVYGAKTGNCTFRGHTFKGKQTIEVSKNEMSSVIVKHTWDKLSNGRFSVSGSAQVTWNLKDPSRHIVHTLTWTRLADGRTGTGSGDRIQKPLAGGISEGFSVDGSRSWQGQRGHWQLDINNVEMRWADPAPQAGSLVLTTPADKTITLVFQRVDADTIGVTANGGNRSFELKVTKLGAVSSK
jgi:hypothetical protein